ncbi:MAG: squalene/phytoene synthase family protein, partial [Gammaproteobacteria bacterium]|nr:squalene/phytoene synthase family protein [Gammaproteobacteria bacterium]
LGQVTSDAERDLALNTPRVIRVTHSFTRTQRDILERCVTVMARGMSEFQAKKRSGGLAALSDLDSYCYYVAGVVGEMLTDLFCDYSAAIARNRSQMMALAVSFGQGLQMTNILKDVWDDKGRGACWLPQTEFERYGVDLNNLSHAHNEEGFGQALGGLIAVARGHLHDALDYTLLIPSNETGIRRFCLWALGMAVLTLRSINNNRGYSSGQEIKISRRAVKATVVVTSFSARYDRLLRMLFTLTTRGLPNRDKNLPSRLGNCVSS